MKTTFVLIFISLLFATAVLAPSIVSLMGERDTMFVMDFNEEENNNKEEKKEMNESDFLFSPDSVEFSSKFARKSTQTTIYLEGSCTYEVDIFLPPPEQTC